MRAEEPTVPFPPPNLLSRIGPTPDPRTEEGREFFESTGRDRKRAIIDPSRRLLVRGKAGPRLRLWRGPGPAPFRTRGVDGGVLGLRSACADGGLAVGEPLAADALLRQRPASASATGRVLRPRLRPLGLHPHHLRLERLAARAPPRPEAGWTTARDVHGAGDV